MIARYLGMCLVASAIATTAFADPAKELGARIKLQYDEIKHDAPAFAVADHSMLRHMYPPEKWPYPSRPDKLVVAASADGNVAWVATDLVMFQECVYPADLPPDAQGGDWWPCPSDKKRLHIEKGSKYDITGAEHVTAVWEKKQGQWQPLAWHMARPLTATEQAGSQKRRVAPNPIQPDTAPGAADAVKLFKASIGDPKLFAASVSDRADVVLYGSDPAERFVGGGAVKKQLAKWGLTLQVRDGIAAGVSSNGNVAWVMANVDASRAKLAAAPYQMFTVYEKTAAGWKLVQIQFSYYG